MRLKFSISNKCHSFELSVHLWIMNNQMYHGSQKQIFHNITVFSSFVVICMQVSRRVNTSVHVNKEHTVSEHLLRSVQWVQISSVYRVWHGVHDYRGTCGFCCDNNCSVYWVVCSTDCHRRSLLLSSRSTLLFFSLFLSLLNKITRN